LVNRAIIEGILHRNRKCGFFGFSGIDPEPGTEKEARFGLILVYVKYVTFSARTMQMRAVTHPCSSSLFLKRIGFLIHDILIPF